MPRRLIVNTSPLIFLSRVDGLEWLAHLCRDTVLVPKAVVAELLEGFDGLPIVDAVNKNTRFAIVDDVTTPPAVLAWDLGAGETQVLGVCLEKSGSVAILDDKAARQCGMSMGIPIVGTLGVILAAKRSGLIPMAGTVVDQLLREGLYLERTLVEKALKEVGE
uniref:Predicted nucleic acid-binding protein, contains PIN domain n=1 Tax=Candidatus Kentrum sp. FW TaxID=2126338 RepID=A0A450T1V1_9GAMM|nr:MAG: Predicted nucleic acid-binding protein, contains PIN domain [Candidatus Kentron sp. FW]VFJ64640.1 MAG: Predicted nucleic acid-binding protein, contains PIN domain [Candidatus Kentron sp. FW]